MILDEIAAAAHRRVARAKETLPLGALREAALAADGTPSGNTAPPLLFDRALSAPGLSFICEVKRASPSRGLIAEDFPYLQIAGEYEEAGAAAISVLTEPEFFLGSDAYLRDIAATVKVPLLRKDFTVDPYQIYQAKILGASAVLLICALLETSSLREYITIADTLGLSCLVEVHNGEEIQSALDAGARIIGINNRDLKTFQVDPGITGRLRKLVPPDCLAVSESGVRAAADIQVLRELGMDAVLIGEALMRSPDKKQFLTELRGRGSDYDEN
ncbi:indole-3-glycerol phosphate synthase TrpC [Treponema sp. TIM-1]|uniref:indole-3-glycerol phosphate synthase TrpC n=1 Tax=Treponema sp. TIM-1 TaxID=2898417 RepID=UPI00397F3BA4